MANTFEAILKFVVATSSTSITISGIPQTYTDLYIVTSMRSTYPNIYNNSATIRWNGDATTTLYGDTVLYQNAGVTSTRYSNSGRNYLLQIDADLSTANTFNTAEIYVPNYTSSTSKQFTSTTMSENFDTFNMLVWTDAGLYTGTSPITSIVFSSNGGTPGFDVGSRIDIYGIKNS